MERKLLLSIGDLKADWANSPGVHVSKKCHCGLPEVAKRHWEGWIRERWQSQQCVSRDSKEQWGSYRWGMREETHVLHLSEHILSTNLYITLIKLCLGKKVLEQLPYTYEQKKFFYLGKFYSSKRKIYGMGPAKSTLTISEIKDKPGWWISNPIPQWASGVQVSSSKGNILQHKKKKKKDQDGLFPPIYKVF